MRVEDRYVSPWQAFWVSFPHTMFAHMRETHERASGVAQASSRSSKIEKKDRTPIRYCMRPILVDGCLTFCDLISCVRLTSYIIARPIIPSGGTQKKPPRVHMKTMCQIVSKTFFSLPFIESENDFFFSVCHSDITPSAVKPLTSSRKENSFRRKMIIEQGKQRFLSPIVFF